MTKTLNNVVTDNSGPVSEESRKQFLTMTSDSRKDHTVVIKEAMNHKSKQAVETRAYLEKRAAAIEQQLLKDNLAPDERNEWMSELRIINSKLEETNEKEDEFYANSISENKSFSAGALFFGGSAIGIGLVAAGKGVKKFGPKVAPKVVQLLSTR